jgi:hypothetical protein
MFGRLGMPVAPEEGRMRNVSSVVLLLVLVTVFGIAALCNLVPIVGGPTTSPVDES